MALIYSIISHDALRNNLRTRISGVNFKNWRKVKNNMYVCVNVNVCLTSDNETVLIQFIYYAYGIS